MSFKFTKKEVSVVEGYLATFIVAAFSMYSSGDHQVKKIIWSALLSTFTPLYMILKKKVVARAAVKA